MCAVNGPLICAKFVLCTGRVLKVALVNGRALDWHRSNVPRTFRNCAHSSLGRWLIRIRFGSAIVNLDFVKFLGLDWDSILAIAGTLHSGYSTIAPGH